MKKEKVEKIILTHEGASEKIEFTFQDMCCKTTEQSKGI